MTNRLNKTSICSVVFLDIAEYSSRSVSEQIEEKALFNKIVAAALKNIVPSDRIILDTGDGAAIALMGEPEEALFVSLAIRDSILGHNKASKPPLMVRIGINLGSVRVVSDINGQLNVIGDAINVAQRIMSFAQPNQILVSRSYFEVASRLTKDLTNMFSYFGVKQDKHVREHEVYQINPIRDESAVHVEATSDEAASADQVVTNTWTNSDDADAAAAMHIDTAKGIAHAQSRPKKSNHYVWAILPAILAAFTLIHLSQANEGGAAKVVMAAPAVPATNKNLSIEQNKQLHDKSVHEQVAPIKQALEKVEQVKSVQKSASPVLAEAAPKEKVITAAVKSSKKLAKVNKVETKVEVEKAAPIAQALHERTAHNEVLVHHKTEMHRELKPQTEVKAERKTLCTQAEVMLNQCANKY